MGNKVKEENQESAKKSKKEAEQVLREAKIIARWDKKPFYIS